MSALHKDSPSSNDIPLMAKDADIVCKISSLTCCVCYEKISETKTLYCGHSLCNEPCLRKLLDQDDPKCPVCNKVVQLPPSGLTSDFPTNFGLGSVLRSYRNFLKSFPTLDSDAVTEQLEKDKPLSKRCGIVEPFEGSDVCKTHERVFRFSCVTCAELDVCFMCIVTSHGDHDFHEKDPADDDGAFLKGFARKIIGQKRMLKEISHKLHQSRDDYLAATSTTREEIQKKAKVIQDKLIEDEKSLLTELDCLTESRKDYFRDLCLTLENVVEKENVVVGMIDSLGHSVELEKSFLEFNDIKNVENILSDVDDKMKTLEELCKCRHPHLQFFQRPLIGSLIGNLQKVCHAGSEKRIVWGTTEGDLSTLNAKKTRKIQADKSCISIIWLGETTFVAIMDQTSTKGCLELTIYRLNERSTQPLAQHFVESAHDVIRVCNSVGLNGRGILLAIGDNIVVMKFGLEFEERPASKRISVDVNIEAVSWGIASEEYFVLSAQPWKIVKVDTSGNCIHLSSLNSPCYGPFLITVNYSFVVADISQNVFIVNDVTKVFPSRQVRGPEDITQAWPAGICLNQETGDWYLLWKSLYDSATQSVDWALTRHTSTFEYRGVIISGAMSERDPRCVSSYKNKLAILFHGGKVVTYTTYRTNISP